MKTGTRLAIVILVFIAFAHLLRLLMSTEVMIENWLVPMWISVVAVLVSTGVALLLYRESRNSH